jgi:alpha-amylase/alpha-mannosidase (GH57 family)
MTIALVVHGHFYQPPRENPWTDLIDREPGAQPFHDWNERVHAECYRPNAFARISDSYGRVERIVNNYSRLSFNFGPTLLAWLERSFPDTYARVLEADRESARRLGGHGNAIAQGFHHAILPLCNERDRRTQVRWGLTDFRLRFRREAESLWLPETACDDATLETLIEEGLRFVVLSPTQAERVRPIGSHDWSAVADGNINTTIPYRYFHRDGSGRSLAVFFYDGQIARAVAFENLLASSRTLIAACERAAHTGAQIVSVATDGESYGHHYRWGDRCIAYALETEGPRRGFRVTNYGEFLDEHEPAFEVQIKKGPNAAGAFMSSPNDESSSNGGGAHTNERQGEGTSWSCPHGVGRWARDCGCHAGAPEGWNQRWREPLRAALDILRDDLAPKFESAAGELFRDPWAARDDYVELLVDRLATREVFFRRHAAHALSRDEEVRALTLLESQRAALTMYTSCGWFFNDISGIETLQVLRYAGRAIELTSELGLSPPLDAFLERLAETESNIGGNGASIFLRTIERSRVTPQRVAAHVAICNLIETEEHAAVCESSGYSYQKKDFLKRRHGRVTLATARLTLEEAATGRAREFALAAMHFGEIDYYCALRPFEGVEKFEAASERLWTQLRAASLPVLLRVAQEEFGPEEFDIEALLPQGHGHLSRSVFDKITRRFREGYEHLYEEHRRVVERLQEIGFSPPPELRLAAEMTLSRRLELELREQRRGVGSVGDYSLAVEIAREAARHGYRIDRTSVTTVFEETVTDAARLAVERPTRENLAAGRALIALGHELRLEANLERAQEAIYEAIHSGIALSDELREFALALDLAPAALETKTVETSGIIVRTVETEIAS